MPNEIILDVIYDAQQRRFFISIDNIEVQTRYQYIDENTINFYNTHAPVESRGKGLAKIVVDAGLKFAAQNNLAIEATCWYAKKVLDEQAKQ